jgi:hypothetical protein
MRNGCVALRKTRKSIDDVEWSKNEARFAAVTVGETPRDLCQTFEDDDRTRRPSCVLELLCSRAPTNAGWLIVCREREGTLSLYSTFNFSAGGQFSAGFS